MIFKLSVVAATLVPFGRLVVMAGVSPDNTNYLNYLLNGGPFALVVFLVVVDKLSPPGERDRLRIELAAANLREETLNANLRDDIVPKLTRTIDALTASTEAVGQLSVLVGKVEELSRTVEAQIGRLQPGRRG